MSPCDSCVDRAFGIPEVSPVVSGSSRTDRAARNRSRGVYRTCTVRRHEPHRETRNQETLQEAGQVRRSASPRLVYGRWSFPECPDRVSGPNRATGPGRGNGNHELARSLRSPSRQHPETQDVLLCHPRSADLLVMNIVAHGDT